MDKGNYTNNIQFETVRKMRTFVSKYTHASRSGTGVSFLRSDNILLRVTLAPTQTIWFQRFMAGLHKQMGDVWIPNTAVSSHIVRASMDVLEDSWHEPNKDLNHKL